MPLPVRWSVWLALARHFFARLFEKESLSPDTDGEANVVQMLALLAAPGGLFCIVMMPFNTGGWVLEGARYFFVSYSMIVMGLVVVFQWDRLFPDRQDYLILRSLPISLTAVFTAKLAALAAFVGLFLLDLNLAALILWPGLDDGKDVLRLLSVHAAAILSGGVFMALAAATIQGFLLALLSPKWFRRVSSLVQTVLMAALVTTFFLFFEIIDSLPATFSRPAGALHWFPGYWFLGLYEWLRPAVKSPALANLGPHALKMLACTASLFIVFYSIGYRRHVRRITESAAAGSGGPARVRALARSLLHRTLLTHPLQRASFHFITATITRSARHRLFLASYAGFGVALAAITYREGRGGLLLLPLMLSFVLVSGLRAAFNFPAELKANFVFQIADSDARFEHLAAMRKWIVVCGVVPLFAVLAPFEFASFPWTNALFHLAFGIALTLLLMQVMFAGFRKIPFTCSYFPGKANLIGLGAFYIYGYIAYSSWMAGLEQWLLRHPAAAAGFFALVAAACAALSAWNKRGLRETPKLDYIDAPDPAVRTLDLAGPVLSVGPNEPAKPIHSAGARVL